MWANVPRAAHDWAHNKTTSKGEWLGRGIGKVRGKLNVHRTARGSREANK